MKYLRIIFLVFINSLVFSQTSFRSKLTLLPHFAVGWAIPPFINGGNSNLVLKPDFLKNNLFGEIVASSGQTKNIYKITNSLGLDANYSFTQNWSANIGINRAMHINLLNDPDQTYISATSVQYNTWIFAYKYTSFMFGARYQIYHNFFQCNINLADKAKEVIESRDGFGGGGVTTNGNGLRTSIVSRKNNTIIISPEYGVTGVSSFDIPMEISVGLNIPTSVFSKEKVTFIRANNNVGENTLNFTQAAIWFRMRIPITVWTNNKVAKKIVPKESDLMPKFAKSVEYDGKKIVTGEKIVLNSLQFEQAKAILTPSAMSELDKVEQFMLQSSSMIIEIIGHTSDEGDRNSNIALSLDRAKACKEYLVKKGIKANRIRVRGMGPDAQLSKTDKALNRRVEMQIIRM
jgi:outer membrane protein OmpA-like peptidoglycan-associated protein